MEIGNYVMFGPQVKIVGKDHNFDMVGVPIIYSARPQHPITTIQNDVWIATRSTILAGITIGTGSIVSAGSVVTKDIPPNSIAAGIPAKIVRKRFTELDFEKHLRVVNAKAQEGSYCNTDRRMDLEKL